MKGENSVSREMIAFRVSADLAAKLDLLAQQTDRSRSGVLRELVRRASVEQPDLSLSEKQGRRT